MTKAFQADYRANSMFMLGDVHVTVVAFESDGSIDPNLSNWTTTELASAKQSITDGLNWWKGTLATYNTIHDLNFEIDFTHLDNPFKTGYETNYRPWEHRWKVLDEFYDSQGYGGDDEDRNVRVRQFEHDRAIATDNNWSFSINLFKGFDNEGKFEGRKNVGAQASNGGPMVFYSGNQSEFKPFVFAHEVGHIFHAVDEYQVGTHYTFKTGYYDVQNLNGANGHPDPESIVTSIMNDSVTSYAGHLLAESTAAHVGWRDSDGDGIFDVLDVPLELTGSGEFDSEKNAFSFEGFSRVGVLENKSRHPNYLQDMTTNTVDLLEYRLNGGDWQEAGRYGKYETNVSWELAGLSEGLHKIELRTRDEDSPADFESGIHSNVLEFNVKSGNPPTKAFQSDFRENSAFLMGNVHITVVAYESDGSLDPNLNDWNDEQLATAKRSITDGLNWWKETLASYNTVHDLNFEIDFTHLDNPFETSYEANHRPWEDRWQLLDQFYDANGYTGEVDDIGDRMRQFEHDRAIETGNNWSFTINLMKGFDNEGGFSGRSYRGANALSGGPLVFYVGNNSQYVPYVFAHETGHIFHAVDEYKGGTHFTRKSGYYDTQNLNGANGHPDPDSIVTSIMNSPIDAFDDHLLSPSTAAHVGWRDSDGDGIFDVLDVPLELSGNGEYDKTTNKFTFQGSSSVGVLENRSRHPSYQHDVTTNTVDILEYRLDGGSWTEAARYGTYEAEVNWEMDKIIDGKHTVELRTRDKDSPADLESGIHSNVLEYSFTVGSSINTVDLKVHYNEGNRLSFEWTDPGDEFGMKLLGRTNNAFQTMLEPGLDSLKVNLKLPNRLRDYEFLMFVYTEDYAERTWSNRVKVPAIGEIIGTKKNDVLIGNHQRNLIRGKSDNDYLDGKGANDVLCGGRGNDTYVSEIGDGRDIVNEQSGGGRDKLLIKGFDTETEFLDSMKARIMGKDLILKLKQENLTSRIRIKNMTDQKSRVESLFSADLADQMTSKKINLNSIFSRSTTTFQSFRLTGRENANGFIAAPVG